jgi:uncharacterized membrane protein YjgN (DUF898 family)
LPPAAAQRTEYPLQFTGSGGEYFRIWIVNLLLTLLTLGIYSAWAKVRKLQYFYRNTQLDGNVFDYHGKPGAILKGRLIALALIVFYNFAFKFSPTLAVVAAALMAVVLPWLLVQSLRFRAHNTSYRSLRFRFLGSVRDGYLVFGLPIVAVLLAAALFTLSIGKDDFERPLLAIVAAVIYVALAVLFPWLHWRVKRFQHANSAYGQARGRFHGKVRRFYAIYGIALLLLFGPILVIGGLVFLNRGGADSPFVAVLAIGALFFFYLMLLGVTPFVQARVQNHVWNSSLLGLVGFDSTLKARRLIWVAVTNILLIIVTLGLFTPFAAVRMYRTRLEAVTVLSVGPLGHYVAQTSAEVGATGEGAADLLDLDFAL